MKIIASFQAECVTCVYATCAPLYNNTVIFSNILYAPFQIIFGNANPTVNGMLCCADGARGRFVKYPLLIKAILKEVSDVGAGCVCGIKS